MKEHIRKIFHSLGLDIRYYNSFSVFGKQREHILNHNGINLVLDVGANTGQYASSLFRAGYRGRVVSFEPLKKAHNALAAKAGSNPNWHLAPRMAAGNSDGEIEINISGNSKSSSILGMNEVHLNADPRSAYIGKEKADIRRLDAVAKEYFREDSVAFLKLDVQGFEKHVLEGAVGILDRVKGIEVELSTVALYKDQSLARELMEMIMDHGFGLWALDPFLYDPKSGRLLQYDGIFIKN